MHRVLPAMAVTIAFLAASAPTAVACAALAAPMSTSSGPTPAMPSDFDGDGYADLAIGAPRADAGRGLVSVIYGGSAGLTAAGD